MNERNAVIAQEIVQKDSGKVVADATVVFVAVDKKHNRAAVFEGEMKAVLKALAAEGHGV